MQALSDSTVDPFGVIHEPNRSATPATFCQRDFLHAASTTPGHWENTPKGGEMKPAASREYLGEQFTALFLGIVVLVIAVLGIDYATGWPIITAAGDAWAQISPYVRIIIVALAAGTLAMLGLFALMVRHAVPVDDNYNPIKIKKEGK